jgi:hypothetical protein
LKQAKRKASEEAREISNICTKLAAFLEKKEQAKKSFKRSNRISGAFVLNLQQFPFGELKQAKRKASEEAREISNICTKLERLPLRTKSARKKKASKEATEISPRICTKLADFLQRI